MINGYISYHFTTIISQNYLPRPLCSTDENVIMTSNWFSSCFNAPHQYCRRISPAVKTVTFGQRLSRNSYSSVVTLLVPFFNKMRLSIDFETLILTHFLLGPEKNESILYSWEYRVLHKIFPIYKHMLFYNTYLFKHVFIDVARYFINRTFL